MNKKVIIAAFGTVLVCGVILVAGIAFVIARRSNNTFDNTNTSTAPQSIQADKEGQQTLTDIDNAVKDNDKSVQNDYTDLDTQADFGINNN